MAGKVWFVGAGPGDPELLTVKGRRLLASAGAVLFAGSLVNQAATLFSPPGCEIRDSKDMTLEEMTAWLLDQAARPIIHLASAHFDAQGMVGEQADGDDLLAGEGAAVGVGPVAGHSDSH